MKRNKLKAIFDEYCSLFDSEEIELPLAAPASYFIGQRPRPLSEKQSTKLLKGHTPNGEGIAIRYEGTALTAAKVANDIKWDVIGLRMRHHYFQEMVRLELTKDLDGKHLRGFYQAGIEMFALNKSEHKKNLIDSFSFMSKFLTAVGKNPVIRISHVNVVQVLLAKLKIAVHDRRRIIGFLENYQAQELFDLISKINIDKKIATILMDIAHIGVCDLETGLDMLAKYPEFYEDTIKDLRALIDNLSEETLETCRFDGGIYRSLDFYSGLVFQCDLDDMIECAGGGEFTGLVESFGVDQKVYSVGMAAGVKRLLKNF